MAQREEHEQRSARDVPPVGRPRGAAWRALQADGVVWEGQVVLVGDDVDLAARMIVTHRRVAFVRGGEIVLEIERSWMRQEPVLRRDGVLELFVAMPGSSLFDEPLTVPIRMREGHPAAGHIIAMLAPGGVRRIAPDSLSGMERARQASQPQSFGGFWDHEEPASADRGREAGILGDDEPGERSLAEADAAWLLKEPPDRVLRVPSTPPRPAQGNGFSIAGMAPRDQRKSPWRLILRFAALLVLLATAAALGAGRLHLPLPSRGPAAVLTAPSPTQSASGTAPAPAAAQLTPDELTAVAIGVGGGDEEKDGAAPAAVAQADTATPAPAVATSTPVAIVAPTKPPIPTPAEVSTPEPTMAPAIASPTAAPEVTAAEAAVASIATPAATPVATPGAQASQPAGVSADQAPAQEIVVGSLRLAFTTALRAETLPKYGLPPGSGDWVLLVATVTNGGDTAATLPLPEVKLFDRGTAQVVDLDTGTDVIASLAGFTPAWRSDDTVSVEPGASTDLLLLYLLPPGSSDDLALVVDQSSLDLAPLLAQGEAVPAAAPELIEAQVTRVINGATIAVELAGVEQTVRYLGVTVPVGDECFASDATTIDAQLVENQEVWLEREATDATDGLLLRDVWIATPDGSRALVAARLLEAGGGTANPVPPDTRYEAWLSASAALGKSNGAGLWSACAS